MNSIIPRNFIYTFIFFLALIVGGLALFTNHTLSLKHCTQTPTVHLGGKVFMITIADTPSSRTQGLSGTPSLAQNAGMLFVFSSSSKKEFWMKDMAYPIDIIWIDAEWRVTGVVSEASPDSYPASFPSPINTRYALEVNAGVAATLGVGVGSIIQNDLTCVSSDF